MSKDTYRGDLAVPQSLNQYAYVMNNPINYVDPTGHIHVYSRDELIGRSRSSLNSLLEQMGDYWNSDKAIFEKTGVWTQQQEEAHANADLIREVLPYIFELAFRSTSDIKWVEQKQDRIYNTTSVIFTFEGTMDIMSVYKNDFETNTIYTTNTFTEIRQVSAIEFAMDNQRAIKSEIGSINDSWNSKPTKVENRVTSTNHATKKVIDITKALDSNFTLANIAQYSYCMRNGGVSGKTEKAQGNLWNDIGNGLKQIAIPLTDFVQGVGAGVLESTSFGLSKNLEVYYSRENETIYLIGKVVGDTATGFGSAIGTLGSGAATVVTSPTGVGAASFGAATVYCGAITVSSTENAVANVLKLVSKVSGGDGSSGDDVVEGGGNTINITNDVLKAPRVGSALKLDANHAFNDIVDNYAGIATKTTINNGTLYQLEGSLNGTQGRFEWIINSAGQFAGQVSTRYFVTGGTINGVPIKP